MGKRHWIMPQANETQIIEWDPPSHKRGGDIIARSWTYDGGADIHNALGLSGEPMVSQIAGMYGTKREEASASKIAENNIAKRQYQKEYMEYWNSTVRSTSTGRPVDAMISPLAPFASARPDRYKYYGCKYARSPCFILVSLEKHLESRSSGDAFQGLIYLDKQAVLITS